VTTLTHVIRDYGEGKARANLSDLNQPEISLPICGNVERDMKGVL
jgi:hypothetical protein